MVISGRWLAVYDYGIAIISFIVGAFALPDGVGCTGIAWLVSGIFIWLGRRAYKSADHW